MMDIEKLARELHRLHHEAIGPASRTWEDCAAKEEWRGIARRFAALVAEECAKLCEGPGMFHEYTIMGAEACAAAIRDSVKP